MSALEALCNAVIGLVVSFALTIAIFHVTPLQSAGVTAIFFVASFVRAYVIRRVFKWLSENNGLADKG